MRMRADRRGRSVGFTLCVLMVLAACVSARAAEIYIDRRGSVQININNLTSNFSYNSANDPDVPHFNRYIGRADAWNPIQWWHQWDLATPSDGNIPIDADEVFTTVLASELFAVIWDVDYPSSNEYDILFWDTVPYAGATGAGFSIAANPAAVNLGRVQGNNNIWGAKRISLDPSSLGPGQTEYFWLQVDEDPGGTAWMSSIDYADLAIVFNEGKLSISKSLTHDSGFDPPRVGHTSYYLVRIDISNPTLTSTGGPVYDVTVTDKFAAGSAIVTNPSLGAATMDAAGNLSWDVGILQDGALNTPPAAGSTDFMVVRVPVTPVLADLGNPIVLNTGATIAGGQVPEDPGDGTGTLYPFNFFSSVSNQTDAVSVVLVTPTTVDPANPGAITSSASIAPGAAVTITVTDADLNVNAAAVETMTVTVRNQRTNELETVTLTETGANTGVFTATLATVPGAAAGADNSGAMNVLKDDVLRATYNETADNTGLPRTLTSDTTVPDDANSITITSPIGDYTTATHDVTGTTDPYSTVTMTHPVSGLPLTATATAGGIYTFPAVAFPLGSTTYTVTSTDPSGNIASAVATVRIDNSNSVTATNPGSGSTINTTATDISGVTDPNSTVTLVEPATGNTLTVTADAAGNYTFPGVGFNTGANTITVTSTDPAGNTATVSANIFVDPDIALNITSITHGAVYSTADHTVAGNTDPLAVLTMIHPNTGALLTTTANAAGAYSFGSFPFPSGLNTVTVNATDDAGNTASATVSFTIDTANTNVITTSGTFTVSYIDIQGTTDPLSTVTFSHPVTGALYNAVADAAGAYVFEDVFFPDGTHAISTTSTDPQGNTAAAASLITVVTTNTILLSLPPNNSVVNTSPLQVCGTTAPGATVSMTDPVTAAVYTQTADANGQFCFAAVNLAAGANSFTMVSTDPNGVSVSHTHNLFFDPNITLNITSPEHNSVHQNTVHDVTGETTPGATVTMTHPISGATLSTVADGNGDYTFSGITFPRGTNVVTVTADDGLGHTATSSNTFVITSLGADAAVGASERVVFGNPVFLEVSDPECYRDSTRIDTIQVLVTNPRTGEFELRTLVETGPDTGIFRGQLNTVESGAAGVSNDGSMAVQFGDTLVTSYTDPIRADGTLNSSVTDTTLITNDGLKINVNLTTSDTDGSMQQAALALTSIAIVEFDAAGQLTGNVYNYTTSDGGLIPAEFIGRMDRGSSYRVLINDPVNGHPYSQSQDFTLADLEAAPVDNRGVRTYVLVLDPAGYVYDALTGARVAGADVSFFHDSGALVAGPFAVFTQMPSVTQTNPQLSGASGIAGGFEFIGSSGGSDITPGFYYITVTFDTNPALANTYLPVARSGASWAGIQEPYTGQVFRVDLQNQPIGMRVPLYRHGQQSPLTVTKVANRDTAAAGDIVTYTLTVRNTGSTQTDPNNPVTIRDTLPQGMAFVPGSAVLSTGTAVAAAEQGAGVVDFTIGALQAAGAGGDSATVHFQAVVDTSARPGMTLLNTAIAMINLVALSNTAQAAVQVVEDPLFDQATLIGRVFVDQNGNGRHDKHEPGVSGAGLILDDGTYVITDESGLYSVPGARPGLPSTGRRTIKLDMNTLPAGARATTPVSQFVILKPGGMARANFGIAAQPGASASEPLCGSGYMTAGLALCAADRVELLSGMFDAAVGTVASGAGAPRPDQDFFPEGRYTRGRAAVFYRLFRRHKLDLTLAYDSEKRHTTDLQTVRDKDLYYPVYGDSSSVNYLTETQGKIFVSAQTPKAGIVAGNYTVSFSDTELASLYRNASGMKLDLTDQSRYPGLPDDEYSALTLFASRRKQMQGITELRSTGGAHYYLAHSDIAPGSERITVEIRDPLIPEKVLHSLILLRDADYEIDYLAGSVRLRRPVARYADSERIYQSGLGAGNPVWLTAEYAYDPADTDYGAAGARFYHRSRLGFGIGATVSRENLEQRDHSLNAVDLHVFSNGAEVFTLETGRSKAQGAERSISHDAGRSFFTADSRHADSGQALKLALNSGAGGKFTWNSYLYDIDAGYSGGAFRRQGVRRHGAAMSYGTDGEGLHFEFTRAETLDGAGGDRVAATGGQAARVMTVTYRNKTGASSVEAELMHRTMHAGAAQSAAYGIETGTTESIAVRYSRIITERITVQAFQQAAFRDTENWQTGVCVSYRMSASAEFAVQVTAGTHGTGGRLGFTHNPGGGAASYLSLETGWSDARGARAITASAGVSQQVSDATRGFIQYDSTTVADEHIRSRVIGVNHDIAASDNMTVSLSAERSEDRSSVQGRYFTNAFGVTGHLESAQGTRLAAEAFYRKQQGRIRMEYQDYRAQYERRLLKNLSTFAEYSYDQGRDLAQGSLESKYTKSLVGLAWRPAATDRVNLIARAGRVREFRSLAVNDALNPDTVAAVFSIEGLYDISNELELREKFAAKNVRQTVAPLPPARARTTLWINGLTWRPSPVWDLSAEYRASHQPLQRNLRNGAALECGYTMRRAIRLGLGYNFSSYSDNAFHLLDHSFKGAFFEISGKM